MVNRPFNIRIGMFLLLFVGISAAALDAEKIHRDNVGAVLVIEGIRTLDGAKSQGSGCVISTTGYVLASAHQTVGMSGMTGRFQDGTVIQLKPVHVDEAREFALLQTNRTLPQAVTIGDADTLVNGSELLSIAAPINLEFSTVLGTVASTNRSYRGHPAIQAGLTATHGSSGGPVFDKAGALIGLITGELAAEQFTIIMPVNNAYTMLEMHDISTPKLKNEGEMESTLIPVTGTPPKLLRAVMAYNNGVYHTRAESKVADYAMAVKLAPEFYEAWFNLGVAAVQMGDTETAAQAFETAHNIRPEDSRSLRNLGRLHLTQKDFKKAVLFLTRASQMDSNNVSLLNDLGEAYRQAGNFNDALRTFLSAIALDPNYASAHYNLGLVYMALKDNTRAAMQFKQYLKLAPQAADRDQVTQVIQTLGQS